VNSGSTREQIQLPSCISYKKTFVFSKSEAKRTEMETITAEKRIQENNWVTI